MNNIQTPSDLLRTLIQVMKESVENTSNEHSCNHTNCSCSDFEDAIQPGCLVAMSNGDKKVMGVVLADGTLMRVSAEGQILGYTSGYTKDTPYKILAVYRPTEEVYALHEYNKMPVMWKRPEVKKVSKTIADLEKELGLAPGTLVIEK